MLTEEEEKVREIIREIFTNGMHVAHVLEENEISEKKAVDFIIWYLVVLQKVDPIRFMGIMDLIANIPIAYKIIVQKLENEGE
jgi:hypothetical protein